MKAFLKLLNLSFGVHEPWYGQRGEPVVVGRVSLPPGVELPAYWRRQGRHLRRGLTEYR